MPPEAQKRGPGRPRNPPAPPSPEKPKRKVGRQSKHDESVYRERLRFNEAKFQLEHPDWTREPTIPSLGDDGGSQNLGYTALPQTPSPFPRNPFFRVVDSADAGAVFRVVGSADAGTVSRGEGDPPEVRPRHTLRAWQDLWKMSLHLFRVAPHHLLRGRLDTQRLSAIPDRFEESDVYRELVFILAHPCWERNISLVKEALETAIFERTAEGPTPRGSLFTLRWGEHLLGMLKECIRSGYRELGGASHLKRVDVRALRDALNSISRHHFDSHSVDDFWNGFICQTAPVWHALAPEDTGTVARWDRACIARPQLLDHRPASASLEVAPSASPSIDSIASRTRKRRKTPHVENSSDDEDQPPLRKLRGRPRRSMAKAPNRQWGSQLAAAPLSGVEMNPSVSPAVSIEDADASQEDSADNDWPGAVLSSPASLGPSSNPEDGYSPYGSIEDDDDDDGPMRSPPPISPPRLTQDEGLEARQPRATAGTPTAPFPRPNSDDEEGAPIPSLVELSATLSRLGDHLLYHPDAWENPDAMNRELSRLRDGQ